MHLDNLHYILLVCIFFVFVYIRISYFWYAFKTYFLRKFFVHMKNVLNITKNIHNYNFSLCEKIHLCHYSTYPEAQTKYFRRHKSTYFEAYLHMYKIQSTRLLLREVTRFLSLLLIVKDVGLTVSFSGDTHPRRTPPNTHNTALAHFMDGSAVELCRQSL